MSLRRTLILGLVAWTAVVSGLHAWLNLGLFDRRPARVGDARPFRVGFIPVTCHLTCPVTNFINEQMTGDGIFEPIRFNGWPELKETYLAEDLEATFLLAPMAMALREQGVPIKVVYLGHRDGTDDDGPQGLRGSARSRTSAARRSPSPTASRTSG